jgi:FtsZ-interacting cell division protein YlmF
VASFFDVIVHLFGFFTTNNQLNKTKTKTKNENQKTKKQNTKHKKQKTKKQKQKQTKQNKTNSVFIEFFSRKRVVPRIPLSA